MADFDAIGIRSDFFPCTGVWNSLVHRVGSSRRCSVKAHGEAIIMRRRAALASALRTAATFPLWLRLNPSTLALCQLAVLLRRQERTGPASMPAAASSGGKASGGRAESKGVAHVFDFPTRPRCVDVHVIVSDAVKGSHIQRSPLSMGGLCELGAVACSRHKKNIAELIMRKNAPLRERLCATLRTSLPRSSFFSNLRFWCEYLFTAAGTRRTVGSSTN